MKIKFYRKLNKLTQREVASLININLSTYRSYEYEKIDPPLKVLLDLSKLFNASIDDIVDNPIKNLYQEQINKIKVIIARTL